MVPHAVTVSEGDGVHCTTARQRLPGSRSAQLLGASSRAGTRAANAPCGVKRRSTRTGTHTPAAAFTSVDPSRRATGSPVTTTSARTTSRCCPAAKIGELRMAVTRMTAEPAMAATTTMLPTTMALHDAAADRGGGRGMRITYTRTSGARSANFRAPMPETWRSSSTLAKRPNAVRRSTMR